jgi:membrane-bound metal-dependent hydrolase YbcI (DUF457 family)
MDPITHALSGAIASRAFLPASGDPQTTRTTRWVVILGAIFPDIDVIAKPFVPGDFATIRFHRSLTHSFVCLPVWAVLFALLAAWFCRRRNIPAPGRVALAVAFGAGIALHIFFDCITSFGTMIWSPISWKRVELDWTFIVDLALTGILLFFLLISWVAEQEQHRKSRAAVMLALMAALVGLFAFGSYALDHPLPVWTEAIALAASALPLAAASMGRPLRQSPQSWCRLGVLAVAAYLSMDASAHHRAVERVRQYVAAQRLDVNEVAAIPLPPNLTMWQGFASSADFVHEWTFSLSAPPYATAAYTDTPVVTGQCPPVLWRIAQVQIWMGFAQFPVVTCDQASANHTAQFTDLRFRRPTFRWGPSPSTRPMPFTWRVTFDDKGQVIDQAWVTR